VLADAGEIDLDAPVSTYWPVFLDWSSDAGGVRLRESADQAGLTGTRVGAPIVAVVMRR